MEHTPSSNRAPGRPRSFDRDAALETAMLLFWQHGYEPTSMRVLTDGMGIAAPSLYAAFGSKQDLFLEALDRYQHSGEATALDVIRDAPSALEAARALMVGSALAFTQPDKPSGCLIASAATSGSPAGADVQHALAAVRGGIEAALRERIEQDKAAGVLPARTDPRTLAALTTVVIQGMSTLARDGAPRDQVVDVATAALAAWPT